VSLFGFADENVVKTVGCEFDIFFNNYCYEERRRCIYCKYIAELHLKDCNMVAIMQPYCRLEKGG